MVVFIKKNYLRKDMQILHKYLVERETPKPQKFFSTSPREIKINIVITQIESYISTFQKVVIYFVKMKSQPLYHTYSFIDFMITNKIKEHVICAFHT